MLLIDSIKISYNKSVFESDENIHLSFHKCLRSACRVPDAIFSSKSVKEGNQPLPGAHHLRNYIGVFSCDI